MSSSSEVIASDVFFGGKDGNECEAFVVAVQDLAFAKGLDEDQHWMLRFARTRLRGKALRWYAKLEPTIKKDWDLFVQALFDQYPLVEEATDEVATPTWSATTFSPSISSVSLPQTQDNQPDNDRRDTARAPFRGSEGQRRNSIDRDPSSRRQYDPSSTGLQIGLLRVVTYEGTALPKYVWWGFLRNNWNWDYKNTTIDRQEALVVALLPSPEPHQIGSLNSRDGFRTLTLGRNDQNAVESHGLCGGGHSDNGYMGVVWNVLADGTLQASLSAYSKKSQQNFKYTTTEVHLNTSGNIWFVRPESTYEEDEPRNKPSGPVIRAKIVFEPL